MFEGFAVESIRGEILDALPLKQPYTLVFCMSDSCGPCVDLVRALPSFLRYYAWQDVDMLCVWAEDIPQTLLKKYDLDANNSFALKGKYRLGAQYPTLFLLDNSSRVVFTTNDLHTMIEKLMKEGIFMRESLVEHANLELWEQYADQQEGKKLLIEFSMEGCPDCENAMEVLGDEDVLNHYQIVQLYRDGARETLGEIDQKNLLAEIYEVDWYPTFVVLDGTGEESIIREVPLDQLKTQLLP